MGGSVLRDERNVREKKVPLHFARRCAFGRSGAQRLGRDVGIPWENSEKYFGNVGFSFGRRCAFGALLAQQRTYEWNAPRKLYRVLRKFRLVRPLGRARKETCDEEGL
jgi:hypothetical protein